MAHPILVPLALLFIAVGLRVLDVGVLRLDEAWGEAMDWTPIRLSYTP